MKFIDVFGMAFSTFVNNKMRTLLTVFGVAIGIGAIVFLVSVGNGLQQITIGEIQSGKALMTYNVTTGNSSILALNDTTLQEIRGMKNVESADPIVGLSGQAIFNNTSTDVLINVASARYVDLEGPSLQNGRYFEDNEKNGLIITSTALSAFGVDVDKLINQEITLNMKITDPANPKVINEVKQKYTVVGIIKDATASYVYIPAESVTIPSGTNYNSVKVKVSSLTMSDVKIQLVAKGYKVSSLGEKIDQINKIFRIGEIVLLILGAIALLVASVGMFNTLTISLLERTRDIGVLKALGATDGEVYAIFLAESTVIAVLGSVAGIILAGILGIASNVFISALAIRAGGEKVIVFQPPAQFVLGILVFSVFIGILTGFYPARRASKLNPLDALRYE